MKTLISQRDLSDYLKISLSTIWRLRRDNPTFPQPFQPSSNSLLFDLEEIDAWLEATRLEGGA